MNIKLTELNERLDKGYLTRKGYVVDACIILQVDKPLAVPRLWLAQELGMSAPHVGKILLTLKAEGVYGE
jgi:biotin operon repressor